MNQRTHFDLLPEELLIEICMYIKSDPILYKLSDCTKKAYVKYLNSVSKGYINNFSYSIGSFVYSDTSKEKLVDNCELPDVVQVDKTYYIDQKNTSYANRTELVYQSTKGNYFYVLISIDHTHRINNFINLKYKNDWTKFWNILGKQIQRIILIKNGYNKFVLNGLL